MKQYLSDLGNIRFVIDEMDESFAIKFDYLGEVKNYHKKRLEYENMIDRLLGNNQQAQTCYYCQQYNKQNP